MKMTHKIEDYLETVFRLSRELDTVGVSDVAKARNVSVPTARNAVNRLQDLGFLHQKHYGKIILHEKGIQKAKEIYATHKTIKRFLKEILLVDEETSEKEACYMEHGLSPETLNKLIKYLEVFDKCENCREKYKKLLRKNLETTGISAIPDKQVKVMTLLDLKPGMAAIIKKIGGIGQLRHRMLDMGIHIGEKVTLVKTAPLKDPLEFSFNGNHISLRRSEAELVQVESVDR